MKVFTYQQILISYVQVTLLYKKKWFHYVGDLCEIFRCISKFIMYKILIIILMYVY